MRERLALAALAAGRNPGGTAVLAAAEDFAIRLEKFFTDMALHKTSPDAPVMEALLCLQRACAAAPARRSPQKKNRAPAPPPPPPKKTHGAAARVRAFCAGGRKSLRLAKAASDSDRVNFPQNLKFGSMYSGLDGVFDALENYVRALHSA